MKLHSNLYGYQEKGVKRIDRFGGRVLLADEMGLGKSIQALASVARTGHTPCVIICPASLKYNWQHEIRHHLRARSVIVNGRKPRTLPKVPFYIINYDILADTRNKTGWYDYFLTKVRHTAVIVDECQGIKNPETLRYMLVKNLCTVADKVLMLSGTPLENRPIELWPILNILDPHEWPSMHEFGLRYCDARRELGKWVYRGNSNLKELHRRLCNSLMVRRTKDEVLKDLPPKTRTVIPIELAKNDYSRYATERERVRQRLFVPSDEQGAANALREIGRLKRAAAKGKLETIREWVSEFLSQTDHRKLILFHIHRSIGDFFREHFADVATSVNGSITGRKRQASFDRFLYKPECRLMIANMQSGGVGWNGVVASDVVFAEMGWKPGEHDQAEARIHRLKQKNACNCWYFVALGTIEEQVCDMVTRKQEVLSTVMDGGAKEGQIDIAKLLIKSLAKQY